MTKARNCVICDFIRVEKSNKLILVGVYSEDIIVSNIPAALPLSFYCTFEIDKKSERKLSLDFEITFPGGKALANSAVEIANEQSQVFTVNLAGVPLQIARSGRLDLKFRSNDSRWRTIASANIRQGEIVT